jgi:hypothetical protein
MCNHISGLNIYTFTMIQMFTGTHSDTSYSYNNYFQFTFIMNESVAHRMSSSNSLDLYLGGAWIRSWLVHLLSLQRFLVVFMGTSKQMLRWYLS